MRTLEQSLQAATEEKELTAVIAERRPNSLESCIDRVPCRALLVLSIFYLGIVAILSSVKLLWLDELITIHIARLGSVAAMWRALENGVDPNPPATYLLVQGSRMLFGDHELAYRFPAVIGYWIGILSLFLYLKRRLSPTWALVGALLSMSMAAFNYSFESRSYGIFYGLAMLAFLCWAMVIDPESSNLGNRAALTGMSFSLAVGLCTNYFAVLAFFPIAIAEIVRTIRRVRASAHEEIALSRVQILRAFDFRVWIALAIAASPLLAFRPLIDRSIAQFARTRGTGFLWRSFQIRIRKWWR